MVILHKHSSAKMQIPDILDSEIKSQKTILLFAQIWPQADFEKTREIKWFFDAILSLLLFGSLR